MRIPQYTAYAMLLAGAVAHPGHDVSEELVERRAFLSTVKRASLEHCTEKLKARGLHERNHRRRAELVRTAREKRGLKKRDFDEVLNTDHNKTDLGYTLNTDAETLFSGQNSCVLAPEVTQGPYYVGGEQIRRDVTESQDGVSFTLDYQVIDVDTCEPVVAYLEIWHCNALGVYSGVVASGNGDSSDSSNLDATWLRGIQKTDDEGVAQFETIVPGFYEGRATHIHLMVHTNATTYANHTLGNDIYASHVGQAFLDQDLITAISKTSAYSSNKQSLTLSKDDSIFSEEAATEGVDPVMEYAMLGDSIEDGLLGWLAFGINTTQSSHISPAVFLYEEGGAENPDSGMGGGGGGGGPGGEGGPGGAPPNGTAGGPFGPGDATNTSSGVASATSGIASETSSADSGSGGRTQARGWSVGLAAMALNAVGLNAL